ncbi:MAG: hypothetical protein ABW096_02100 [Candidatus Thiodiazotropha sp.]
MSVVCAAWGSVGGPGHPLVEQVASLLQPSDRLAMRDAAAWP